ncbi:MAG: GNAT family N-acetyltransferase [Marmoricola sp.]
MDDFRTRPATADDAAAIKDLLAAAESVDHTDEHYTVADVVEEIENPMIDLARDWLVVERAGALVGQCRLMPRAPADGVLSVAVDGTVHPAHRRQGIGSHVVPLMLRRAHDYVRERGDLRPVVTADAPSTNTDLASILARHGLHPYRWTFAMEAGLADVEEVPALPDGYRLSTWEGVDQDEMRRAHNQAFVGHPGFTPWNAEMWDQWVALSRNYRPALSLIARDASGDVAAYVQSVEFDAVAEVTGVREAYVGKVGTLPAHRRRGLAGVLLRTALQRYRDAGFDRAALDVDSENPTGALGIYEQAGFRTTKRWTNYLLAE